MPASTQSDSPVRTRGGRRFPLQIVAPNTGTLLVKVIGLGLALAFAISFTPVMIATGAWFMLVAIWLIVLVLIAVYLTGRVIPLKYLVPGTLLLVMFTIYPIILTMQMSFTNYGDGTRSTKEQAIARIISTSAVPVDGATQYSLQVGTTGTVNAGPYAMLLVDRADGKPYLATEEDGLQPFPDATVENGTITEAPGYTILTKADVNTLSGAGQPLDGFGIAASDGTVIKMQGFSATEMRTPLVYDADADTITNTDTGTVYSPVRSGSGDRSFFTSPDGERLSNQSWGEGVGWFNYHRLFTDSKIVQPFLGIFVWTVIFAVVVVGSSFLLGLFLAVTMNEPRLKAQKFFRAIMILPYAIPGFILLLVWVGFWNRDYGLINTTLGMHVDWLGDATYAKFAVLITQLWMGFPYMFLISTGALQSIPTDLKEAASIDGATGMSQFWRIVFPLLMVSVAPLLVASFAFNFNNFNAIQLLTGGGPFDATNPTAGKTDILISYTYRLAFGGVGEQIGFASAVSVVLFILTAVIAAIQFRGTRKLEEIY